MDTPRLTDRPSHLSGRPEREKDTFLVLPGLEWVKRVGFQSVALTKFVFNPFALSLSFDFAQDIRENTDRGEPVEPQAQDERSGSGQMKRETDSVTHWKPGWT